MLKKQTQEETSYKPLLSHQTAQTVAHSLREPLIYSLTAHWQDIYGQPLSLTSMKHYYKTTQHLKLSQLTAT